MKGSPQSRRRHVSLVAFYALAARIILPRRFREQCGDSLVETFSDSLNNSEAQLGFWGRVLMVGEEFLGLLVAAVREHRRGFKSSTTPHHDGPVTERGFDMSWFPRELRYSFRTLAKSPGVTLSASVALALGIAATTTMFSVSHGLLRDLPVDEPDRLVHLGIAPLSAGDDNYLRVSVHELTDWRTQQSSLERLAAFASTSFNLSAVDERPERVNGARVSADAFEALRVDPVLGRHFRADEELPGAEPVVILGCNLWGNRYGFDRDVLGRTVRVDGVQRTVIGVMPEGFHFPEVESLWIPLELDQTAVDRGDGRYINAFGRLAEDVTLEQAQAEYSALFRRLEIAYPDVYDEMQARAIPFKERVVELEAVLIMNLMLVVVSFVLIVACANVANLLLARAASRSREVAVRTALGASRARVMAQMLVESLIISCFGGFLGIALAYVGVAAFNAPVAPLIPFYWMDVRVDGTVLMFSFLLVLGSSVVAGTAPALKATGVNVNGVLKDQALGVAGLRLGHLSRVLVVGQVALSCGLLTVSGLMVKGTYLHQHGELAFATTDVLTARVTLLAADYPDESDRDGFYRELVSRLEDQPRVVGAAVVSHLPGVERGYWHIQKAGTDYEDYSELPTTSTATISPGFFRTLDVELVEGREFSVGDDANNQPVVVVNQSFADRFFPGESPLGRQIKMIASFTERDWMTIVGIAPDLGMNRQLAVNADGLYVPFSQQTRRGMSLLVRTQGDPLESVANVREVVASLDPHLPIYRVNSLAQTISNETVPERAFSVLFVCCGAAALMLAVVGLYGVMAFTVRRRTKEIGIRMALGARTKRILWLGLRGGLVQLAIGLIAGAGIAALIAPPLADMLFGTSPWDLQVYVPIALILCCSGVVASIVPAAWATRVDPMETLRCE